MTAIPLGMDNEEINTHSPFSESDLYSPFEALFFAASYNKCMIKLLCNVVAYSGYVMIRNRNTLNQMDLLTCAFFCLTALAMDGASPTTTSDTSPKPGSAPCFPSFLGCMFSNSAMRSASAASP